MSHLSLVHVFHAIPLRVIHGWSYTIPVYTTARMVRYCQGLVPRVPWVTGYDPKI
jgi:hypothetical protein